MKSRLHSATKQQIEKQASNLGMATCISSLENINYQSLIRNKLATNKGSFGTVAIIGGAKGMHGSLYLAGRAAMLCGAGKVVLSALDPEFETDLLMPELLTANPKDVLKTPEDYSVIVVGPGLGSDERAQKILEKILNLQPQVPIIFDADALNLIAINTDWHFKFRVLPYKAITPHAKEAARLLGVETGKLLANRVAHMKGLSEHYNAVTLLKGYASLMYNGQELWINPTGNQGLSNAGQGDALCGIIAAVVAQGLPLLDALRFSVYLHGRAADELVDSHEGYIGIVASKVTMQVQYILNQILKP